MPGRLMVTWRPACESMTSDDDNMVWSSDNNNDQTVMVKTAWKTLHFCIGCDVLTVEIA